MPRKCVCVALVAIFALGASGFAQAQVTVDVTKVNCDQFVHHKISEPRLIAAWLSGYYNAKRNNRVIDLQTLEDNMTKVKNYCSDEKNFKVPVMKAVGQVLGKKQLGVALRREAEEDLGPRTAQNSSTPQNFWKMKKSNH